MAIEQKAYNLTDEVDVAQILTAVAMMNAVDTITFLMATEPTQGDFGKLGNRANQGRPMEKGSVALDLVQTADGPMIYATSSASLK